MSVNSITNNNPVIHPKGTSQQMDQGDFLRLMTAQLSQQDPFNPVDNQQMVAQMAQFSSLAGISETNNVLAQISEQLTAQTQLRKDFKAATPAPPPTPQEEYVHVLLYVSFGPVGFEDRSDGDRVGKEWVVKGNYRWYQYQ